MTNDVSDVGGTGKCSYCGRQGHGKSPSLDVRKDKCRAWGKSCNKCSGETHFANFCKQSKPAAANTVQDVEETQLFNMFSEPSRPLTWHVTSLASGSSGVQSHSQVSTLTLQCPAGVGKDGVTMVSMELCYIAKGVNRLLLSINSGIISNDFPSISSSADNVSVNSCAQADEGDQCSCPKGTPTSPAPSQQQKRTLLS